MKRSAKTVQAHLSPAVLPLTRSKDVVYSVDEAKKKYGSMVADLQKLARTTAFLEASGGDILVVRSANVWFANRNGRYISAQEAKGGWHLFKGGIFVKSTGIEIGSAPGCRRFHFDEKALNAIKGKRFLVLGVSHEEDGISVRAGFYRGYAAWVVLSSELDLPQAGTGVELRISDASQ